MTTRLEALEERFFSGFDICLIIVTTVALIASYFFSERLSTMALAGLSFLGLIPVAWSAGKALLKRTLSVDLLASIALIFSLISHEWSSAAFITLMLAFARLFDRITAARAKRVIQSLMKYHVEQVRVKIGENVKDIHVSEVRKGDIVIVEAGDRMPVDGIVVSGTAAINESSLTGESELIPKKVGDHVSTATVNESGSLLVRTERVGADTTLSRMIGLIEEASRDKNKAEKTADKFTEWYIFLSLVAAVGMYLYGFSPRIILSVLLVVCADDIAVAVPLAFTAAIARAAKRGIIVKGSTVFEQLSRLRYILTDKTGTLTRGHPKIVDVHTYGSWKIPDILERFGMGASESRHMVSRAIVEYLGEKKVTIHAPDESTEVSGEGIVFHHKHEQLLLGRLSFMEAKHVLVPEKVRADIQAEKDAGRGVALLAAKGEIAGMVSYADELRPHAKEIIGETQELGVREWHMLTGDNERVAAAVAHELGMRHYHSNLSPQEKVSFVRHFEREHSITKAHTKSGEEGVVGYIGDGVNDAASLALADVSIAMGGIGSDAAIEAADITIMKDHLDRIPEVMRIGKSAMNIMWQNFGIWAITNVVGLGLVAFGFIGPAGAATYNFLTDFLPIGNALRAGKVKRTLNKAK